MKPSLLLQCGHDPEAVESHAPALMRDGRSNRASMRPRPGGRGEQFLTGHPVVDRVRASMRPRPGGRGETSQKRGGPTPQLLQCGHDPEAVERLRPTSAGCWCVSLQCGHDPEAVERRSDTTYVPGGSMLQCGHDPEAVESPALGRRGRPAAGASMRPRPGGRGESRSTVYLWPPMMLQCGHDPEAVESVVVVDVPLRRSLASMRPRPGGRGEPGRDGYGRRIGICASMRPRPGGRGEANPSSTIAAFTAWLQCGHDPEAVESALPRPGASSRRRGFNAATTRRPWRERNPGGVAGRRHASMRPRPGGRGEATESVMTDRCGLSFNAATTRRPWRDAD